MIHLTHIVPPVGTPPDDWPAYSWFAIWDQPVGVPCGLEVEGEVILVDGDGLARWRTVVTDLALIPFEHVAAALNELRHRWCSWSISPAWNGPAVSPGMLVAWRARPVSYLGLHMPEGGGGARSHVRDVRRRGCPRLARHLANGAVGISRVLTPRLPRADHDPEVSVDGAISACTALQAAWNPGP
jgi:hypothetical protein